MEIKKKIAPCSCCGNNCEFLYGFENYNAQKFNLESYINYKDIYVFICPKCGFISTDLSGADNNLYLKVKDSDEFINAINYKYLNGLNNKLYENHSKSVPANIYDAYSVMLKASGNKELYLRTLNRSIELKEVMLQKYQLDSENEYDSDENQIFDKLEELIYDNIDDAREMFINEVSNDVNSNVFLHLMAIENLCSFEEYKSAKKQFEIIKKQVDLSDDLIEYFENLLNN